jgi:hypothetical protein
MQTNEVIKAPLFRDLLNVYGKSIEPSVTKASSESGCGSRQCLQGVTVSSVNPGIGLAPSPTFHRPCHRYKIVNPAGTSG